MNIELKNFKHSEFMSQETHAFEATVWVDGKRAFTAENDGHGGADFYLPVKGQTRSDMTKIHQQIRDHHLEKVFNDMNKTYFRNCPDEDNEWVKNLSDEAIVEIVIADLITKKLMTKTLKQRFRKNVLILEEDGSISLLGFKGKPKIEPIHIAVVEDQHPDAIIMNTLPLDKAVDIYMTAIDKHDRESREGKSS